MTRTVFWDTVTNAAYLVAALAIGLLGAGSFVALLLAFACVYLAIGSGLHHSAALRNPLFADLDISAMYVLFGGFLAYALATAFGLGDVPAGLLVAAIIVPLALLRFRSRGYMRLKIGILLGCTYAVLLARAFYHGQAPLLWPMGASVVLFGLALYLRDEEGQHAVWHLLTAAGLPFLYLAIR